MMEPGTSPILLNVLLVGLEHFLFVVLLSFFWGGGGGCSPHFLFSFTFPGLVFEANGLNDFELLTEERDRLSDF